MFKKKRVVGMTEVSREVGSNGRVIPLEKNLDTLTRVLNQVRVVRVPGISVVMAKKDGQFLPSAYTATGDNCTKSEVSKG